MPHILCRGILGLALFASVGIFANFARNSEATAPPAQSKHGPTDFHYIANTDSDTSGIIKQAVLAKRVTPLWHSPVDITDRFPTSRGSIWLIVTVANAPQDTRFRAVLTAVDTGNAAPPNTKISESESTADEHSIHVEFHWTYDTWPKGTYKVDVYLNGKLDRTLSLATTEEAIGSSNSGPEPAAIGGCPKLPPTNAMPPGFPMGVAIAQGRDAQGNPLNPGRIFRPDSPQFYAVLITENVPANTRMAARWFATDVGGLEPCNTQFASYELVVEGSGKPWFAARPPVAGSKWPEGIYRVEIYVNDNLAALLDFGVCDGSCNFEIPLVWRLR